MIVANCRWLTLSPYPLPLTRERGNRKYTP
jgi:hypothetical protein